MSTSGAVTRELSNGSAGVLMPVGAALVCARGAPLKLCSAAPNICAKCASVPQTRSSKASSFRRGSQPHPGRVASEPRRAARRSGHSSSRRVSPPPSRSVKRRGRRALRRTAWRDRRQARLGERRGSRAAARAAVAAALPQGRHDPRRPDGDPQDHGRGSRGGSGRYRSGSTRTGSVASQSKSRASRSSRRRRKSWATTFRT